MSNFKAEVLYPKRIQLFSEWNLFILGPSVLRYLFLLSFSLIGSTGRKEYRESTLGLHRRIRNFYHSFYSLSIRLSLKMG